ncbi:hypothetical protein KXW38_008998 [Aspergillus fumigatus]|nr:hypothetical protein KXW38_008998 [Aspergillus fumigatus]
MSFDVGISGHRALVTAGTKGAGAAVVQALADAGAKVVATARTLPENSLSGVHYIAADISTAEGCTTVARGVLDRLGGVDIIVNMLGGSSAPPGGFAALTDDGW